MRNKGTYTNGTRTKYFIRLGIDADGRCVSELGV